MLGHLSDIVGAMLALVPRLVVVRSDQRAVKFSRGKRAVELAPGVHWWWPLLTPAPIVLFTSERSFDLPAQTLVTSDARSITIALAVVYRVVRVRLAVTKAEDLEDVLHDRVAHVGAEHVARRTFASVIEDVRDGSMIQDLTRDCAEEMGGRGGYGVRVLAVRIRHISPTRSVSLQVDGMLGQGATG